MPLKLRAFLQLSLYFFLATLCISYATDPAYLDRVSGQAFVCLIVCAPTLMILSICKFFPKKKICRKLRDFRKDHRVYLMTKKYFGTYREYKQYICKFVCGVQRRFVCKYNIAISVKCRVYELYLSLVRA